MSRSSSRTRLALVLALLASLALAGTGARSDSSREPNKLVILSTTDVKGKTSPCG